MTAISTAKYLSQLDNKQVSFSVKQGKPKTVEAAVSATLECESYLVRPLMSCGAVTPAQVESKDNRIRTYGYDDAVDVSDG